MLVLGGERLDLSGDSRNARVELTPVFSQVSNKANDAQRQGIRVRAQDAWQRLTQGREPLPHGDAPLKKEAADLVGDARALADQTRADPVQGEQIHLVRGLDRHERHGRPLHGLRDGLCIPIVILVPLQKRLHILSRDEAYVVAEPLKLTADVVGAGTGFHADQAGWDISQALRELGSGELDAQHDGTALILTDEVEAVLAQIDAQGGDRSGGRKP